MCHQFLNKMDFCLCVKCMDYNKMMWFNFELSEYGIDNMHFRFLGVNVRTENQSINLQLLFQMRVRIGCESHNHLFISNGTKTEFCFPWHTSVVFRCVRFLSWCIDNAFVPLCLSKSE